MAKAKTPKKKAKRTGLRHKLEAPPPPGQVAVAPSDTVFAQPGLLEHYRARWQHADWTALIQVGIGDIRSDPDRGKLAALIASVHSAFGDLEKARAFFTAALEWGCDRRIATQLMISAAQNSLGRANTAIGDTVGAARAFNEAIALVEPRSDVMLLGQMRRIRETVNMGLRSQAMRLVDEQILSVRAEPEKQAQSLPMIATALDLLEQRSAAMKKPGRPASTGDDETASGFGRPWTIVVGTQPRTGSTWVYNAVRFLLEQAGVEVYASWCEHYRGGRDSDKRTHVVKVHEEKQLTFPYDLLITTHRDLADRLGSVIRMGWLSKTEEAVLNARRWAVRMDEFWASRSDLVIDFDQIESNPENAILGIARVLGVSADHNVAQRVIGQIRALRQPARDQKFDPLTLLHPGHQSDGSETRELSAWVRSILDKQDNESAKE